MKDTVWKIPKEEYNLKNGDWLVKTLAKNRGLNTKRQLDEFLHPTLAQILTAKPTELSKAVERVSQAVKKGEKTIVYSDYDADGICASAILWETLYDLGANCLPYVPHRIKEGYGLSIEGIKKLAAEGAKLIITVDHGVTARKQIEAATKLGIETIITDHHLIPKNPPKPYAMVHTTSLCGAGVAWRFAWEIVEKLKPSYKDTLLQKLELAAIATVADLVPLTGANRSIVALGLEKIATSERPGLKSLIKQTGITGRITTYEIGHILAPRINAMGRIEHGIDSLRLLCAKNQAQAEALARLLTKTNNRRQDLTVSAVNSAVDMVRSDDLVGVVAHHTWHEGVIGLVASRLVEAHHKPMVVISLGEVFSKGSARSIPGFNIVDAIRSSSQYLVDAGGHPMAAGFTIETRHIEIFSKKINAFAAQRITEELLTPTLVVECVLPQDQITAETLLITKQFEPYGIGNPQPIFLTTRMLVEDARFVGTEAKHLKMQLAGCEAIWFNARQNGTIARPGNLVDVVYTLYENRFNGSNSLQMKIKDLKIIES